ncbi:MAG: hypothetical protein HYT62_04365 [Candidatus Yanofskybacteria bacterium]|nr:hypothetical protein [Candidatus Yanofskybacteria bacterium]
MLSLWPVFLLLIVYSLAYYNVDYFLIPTLLALGFTRGQVLLIAGLWGFLDMLGGYIGWSGFRGLMAKVFEKDIIFMKKVAGEEEARGVLETIQVYFVSKYLKFLNGNSQNNTKKLGGAWYKFIDRISDRMIRFVLGILKGGSYVLIFIIGAAPFPGPRMVSDIFCGSMRWKKGFATVALGNFVKTLGFVYGWNWMFS